MNSIKFKEIFLVLVFCFIFSSNAKAVILGDIFVAEDVFFEDRNTITTLSNGQFVVTWIQLTTDTFYSTTLYVQKFNSDGSKSGEKIPVFFAPLNQMNDPSITPTDNGGFIITWETIELISGLHEFSIQARVFDQNGVPTSTLITKFNLAGFHSAGPEVKLLSDNRFIITWMDVIINEKGISIDRNIYAQIFNIDGSDNSNEFIVNTGIDNYPIHSTVAELNNGNIVIAWQGDYSSETINAQLFTSNGVKIGQEFTVATAKTNHQIFRPAIISLANGHFLISWRDHSSDYSEFDSAFGIFYGQLFDIDGSSIGSEITLRTATECDSMEASVVALNDGRFVSFNTCYYNTYTSDINSNISGQMFESNGQRIGDALILSSSDQFNSQSSPRVTLLNDGGSIALLWVHSTSGYNVPPEFQFRGRIIDFNANDSAGISVIGTVYDGVTTNLPIEGATVTLKRLSEEWSVQTDASGGYTFTDLGLSSGDYSLVVTKDGFGTIGNYGTDNTTIAVSSSSTEFSQDFHLYYCVASQCEEDGVFFKLKDDAVKSSIKFDNDEAGWTYDDQLKDYCGETYISCDDTFLARYISEDSVYAHKLYSLESFSLEAIEDDNGLIKVVDKEGSKLNGRKPLILVHGWQGDDHAFNTPGDNSYLGFNYIKNLPDEYFQELLQFRSDGCSEVSGHSEAAKYLCDHYKIYVYHYPSFEHVTYNGRMLSEAIRSTPELWDYIQNDGKLTVVAHSMGGLVTRSFIEEWGVGKSALIQGPGIPENDNATFDKDMSGDVVLDKLITLATPHHGSPAAIKRWIDISDVLKERRSPGALDLYWDDFDGAVLGLLGRDFITGYCSQTRIKKCIQFVYTFPERDKVRPFDLEHSGGEVELTETNTGDSRQYYHPNPWLRELNQNIQLTSVYRDKYYFYGGSAIFGGSFIDKAIPGRITPFCKKKSKITCGVLDPTPTFNLAAGVVHNEAYYALNDAVVPTSSAFFDSDITWIRNYKDWENNITHFLKDADFTHFNYKEDNTLHHSRYFYDYDHDKMRGGAGNKKHDDFNDASDYGDDWQDKIEGHNVAWRLLSDINYPGSKLFDPVFASSRLQYEPLFLRMVMDLGFDGSSE